MWKVDEKWIFAKLFFREKCLAVTIRCSDLQIARLDSNLRRLHRSKKNYRNIIIIGQIIGSCQINSFMCIELVIASISIFIYRKFIAHRLNFRFKLKFFSASIFWEMAKSHYFLWNAVSSHRGDCWSILWYYESNDERTK